MMSTPAPGVGVHPPVVVSSIDHGPPGLWRVRTQDAAGTVRYVLVPDSIATVTGVKIATAAMSMLVAMGKVP